MTCTQIITIFLNQMPKDQENDHLKTFMHAEPFDKIQDMALQRAKQLDATSSRGQ